MGRCFGCLDRMWHHAAGASLLQPQGKPGFAPREGCCCGVYEPCLRNAVHACICCHWCQCTQVLQWPNGVPVTSGCGAPVALNSEGLPVNGPGGLPCCLGPDGDLLLTWEGKALLGPQVGLGAGNARGWGLGLVTACVSFPGVCLYLHPGVDAKASRAA